MADIEKARKALEAMGEHIKLVSGWSNDPIVTSWKQALAALGQEEPEERWTKGRHVSAQFFGGHEILDEKGEVIAVVAWHADRVARLPELERAAKRLVDAVTKFAPQYDSTGHMRGLADALSSILEQKP